MSVQEITLHLCLSQPFVVPVDEHNQKLLKEWSEENSESEKRQVTRTKELPRFRALHDTYVQA
tara:strand:+ start:260 stop:448 length:189 start_codon:yes stop_codon:yes gene_type:complete